MSKDSWCCACLCTIIFALSLWACQVAFQSRLVEYKPTPCVVLSANVTNFTNSHHYDNCKSDYSGGGYVYEAFSLDDSCRFKSDICCDQETLNYRLVATLSCDFVDQNKSDVIMDLCGVFEHAICYNQEYSECIADRLYEPSCGHVFARSEEDLGDFRFPGANVTAYANYGKGLAYNRNAKYNRSSQGTGEAFAVIFVIVCFCFCCFVTRESIQESDPSTYQRF